MASGPSSSSAQFYGIREEDLPSHLKTHALHHQQMAIGGGGGMQQPPPQAAPAAAAAPPAQPAKKKRNTPGAPYPDAEIIALSPKTLMATNRFLCEVCGKGFQREQNLQLHRRGHNLPWKLKQKNPKDAQRRRVYLCPEPTCVHHEPSRALGDLTGIKKHFCRKHGEKKWKCDKCSKRYAVQSDWKAHAKTCGTREYRCDCGTLFSRRDSFITHRAFCDALAQETARIPTGLGTMGLGNHLFGAAGGNPMTLSLAQLNSQFQMPTADILRLGANGNGAGAPSQFDHILNGGAPPSMNPSFKPPTQQGQIPGGFFLGGPNNAGNGHHNSMTQDHYNVDEGGQQQHHHHQASLMQQKPFHGGSMMSLPDLQSNPNAGNAQQNAANGGGNGMFNLGFFSNSSSTSSVTNSNGNNGGGGGAGSNNNNAGGSSGSQNYHHHNLSLPDQQYNMNNSRGVDIQTSAPMFSPIGLMGGNDHGNVPTPSIFDAPVLPQMSATALLQKAAQMGATSSGMMSNGAGVSSAPHLRPFAGLATSRMTMQGTGFRAQMDNDSSTHFQDLLMSSLAGGVGDGLFDGGGGGGTGNGVGAPTSTMYGASCNGSGAGNQDHSPFGGYAGLSMFDLGGSTNNNCNANNRTSTNGNGKMQPNVSDGLTRDFLGVGGARPGTGCGGGGAMAGGHHHQREHQQPRQQNYGLGIGTMDSSAEMKSAAGSNNTSPFGGTATAGPLH